MNISDKVKMEFEDAIRSAIKDWQRDADEPANLFPRNRKLDKMTMIKQSVPLRHYLLSYDHYARKNCLTQKEKA